MTVILCLGFDRLQKSVKKWWLEVGGTSLPLMLYSTITRLAYLIAHRYYGDIHYAWCAPGESHDRYDPKNPSSSHPIKLYRDYLIDIKSGDRHSARIAQNRIGLTRGAEARLHEGVINERDRDRIIKTVDAADLDEFVPFMLVIPFDGVQTIAELVPVDQQARATSEEYIIKNLPRNRFDILRLSEIRE